MEIALTSFGTHSGSIVGIGVAEFSVDGKLRNANKEFLKMMGCSLKEVTNTDHDAFVPEELKLEYQHFWLELLKGNPTAGVYRRRPLKGKAKLIYALYIPQKNTFNIVEKVIMIGCESAGK